MELKTILLKVSKYKIAVHIRGCDKICNQAIKKIFKSKNISFLDSEFLTKNNLYPGIINPWNISFCHFNLVCLRLFINKFMTTNNSKLTEGIIFRVEDLLLLNNVIIGYWGQNV
jgi:hypothetical protein